MTCPACQAETDASAELCFQCGRPLHAVTRGVLIASRYEVLGVLGRGGMGVVYRAHDRLLDEVVAIKVLRREVLATPEAAKRFRAEIKLARKVSHHNVCRIHEYGEDGDLSFISMAFIEGKDMRQRLAQHPEGLPTAEALEIATQSARGLQAIHDAGIIHRDFKTSNIMYDALGVIRLMDFGVAKDAAESASTALTGNGSVVGTPEFMSPEQCRGERLDPRTDIYSLGIVIFELFTGEVPFRGETLMATLFKHIQEPPPLEGGAAARIPPAVVSILRRALAKLPQDRPATAGHVARALEQAAQQSLLMPVSQPAPTKERRETTRLEIPLAIVLKRTSPQGTVLQEERTIADNLSRHGLRVLTSLASVSVGDVVVVEEFGGDFKTRALVRHRSLPKDGIARLGLELLDREAPDRLVQIGDWTSAVSRTPTPRPRSATEPKLAPIAALAADGPPDGNERRSSSRIAIPLEVVLERLSEAGHVVQQERTLAENVGRQGARVLTAMQSVATGEVMRLREVNGDFETRVSVRHAYTARDRVRRLNLEFVDRDAPDRLVPTEAAMSGGR
jgi:serine/threonine protein kinase